MIFPCWSFYIKAAFGIVLIAERILYKLSFPTFNIWVFKMRLKIPGYALPDVEVFNYLILNLKQDAHQIEIELERQSRIIY